MGPKLFRVEVNFILGGLLNFFRGKKHFLFVCIIAYYCVRTVLYCTILYIFLFRFLFDDDTMLLFWLMHMHPMLARRYQ